MCPRGLSLKSRSISLSKDALALWGLWLFRFAPQLMHHPEMRNDSAGHGRVFVVSDAKLRAGLPHDMIYRRIMDMADPGKEMVFDLEIKASDIPGDDLIAGGEIRSGLYLMDRPFFFQLYCRIRFDVFETCGLHNMRQLKHDGQDKAKDEMHAGKTPEPGLPAYKIDGYQHIEQEV